MPELHTFSIVARCPRSGIYGVAVASAIPCVGAISAFAAAAEGAIATQAWRNPYLGIDGLERLKRGATAASAPEALIAGDARPHDRQLGLVDHLGGSAAWTGRDCTPWAGHGEGEGYAVQGNMVPGEHVLAALEAAFLAAAGHSLSDRLVAALQAGERRRGPARQAVGLRPRVRRRGLSPGRRARRRPSPSHRRAPQDPRYRGLVVRALHQGHAQPRRSGPDRLGDDGGALGPPAPGSSGRRRRVKSERTMPVLFDPTRIGGLTFANRIAVSPTCQFAAVDGIAGAWHLQHIGGLALSGAGLLIFESTVVSEWSHISKACLGPYEDRQASSLKRLVEGIGGFSPMPLGIQLAHAGRKGSVRLPWESEGPLQATEGGWRTIGAMPPPFDDRAPSAEATGPDLKRIVAEYAGTARRAVAAGFALVELHAAHGYLLHQFLSPFSNRRDDGYGGTAPRRMRFPLEVFRAMRAAVPARLALGVRISGSDWCDSGDGIEEAPPFAAALEQAGADYLCASSGGIVPGAKVEVGPSYQVPFAATVRKHVRIPVMAVGMIADAHLADGLVASGKADVVALAFLDDPRWGLRAARQLGVEVACPLRYQAAHPRHWPPAGEGRPAGPPAAPAP